MMHWLLDVALGGRVLRFAVEDVDVDGTPYAGGLEDLEVTLGDGRPTVAVAVPGAGVAQLVADGVDLSAATATLWLWEEGTAADRALVAASGRAVAPEYGADDEALTFSIERDQVAEEVPPAAATLDETTWPISSYGGLDYSADEQVLGTPYPIIIGRPGADAGIVWASLTYDVPGSPGYIAEHWSGAQDYEGSKILIAGHEVAATVVKVTDMSAGYTLGAGVQELAVEHVQDRLGRTVAVVQPSPSGAANPIQFNLGSEYWVTWSSGGGAYNRDRSGALRGAGEVIEYLLLAAGLPVDRGRMRAACRALDRVRLDAVIAERTSAEAWVEDQLGRLLPLLRRESDAGIWYELLRYDATAADAVARLVAGRGCERNGPIGYASLEDVANVVTLRYGRRADGLYAKRRTLSGAGAGSTDPATAELGSYLCAVSQSRYGRRAVEVESDVLYEDASAGTVLAGLALWRALPRRSVAVSAGPELRRLEPGAVVTYADAAARIPETPALVREVRLTRQAVGLSLELLDRPALRRLGAA